MPIPAPIHNPRVRILKRPLLRDSAALAVAPSALPTVLVR
jgi:hypothetical protein